MMGEIMMCGKNEHNWDNMHGSSSNAWGALGQALLSEKISKSTISS